MTFLRNPYFLAALVFFVLGAFATVFTWWAGLMLLMIAFLCAFAGVTLGMMRNRHQGAKPAGGIQLHDNLG